MAKVGEISQEKISYDKVEKVKATTRYSMDAMKNDRTAQDDMIPMLLRKQYSAKNILIPIMYNLNLFQFKNKQWILYL